MADAFAAVAVAVKFVLFISRVFSLGVISMKEKVCRKRNPVAKEGVRHEVDLRHKDLGTTFPPGAVGVWKRKCLKRRDQSALTCWTCFSKWL